MRIHKKIISLVLSMFLALTQIMGISTTVVKAEDSSFSVDVQVDGIEKDIALDKSSKSNALDALVDVLNRQNKTYEVKMSSWGGKYISSVDNIKEKEYFNGQGGWMYTIKRNGNYIIPSTSIDAASLENGDKLLLYYAVWGTTYIPNKIDFSTTLPSREMTITLNNSDTDWQTGKEVIIPINNVKAKVDGKDIPVNENKVNIKDGLNAGRHSLELSDYNIGTCPKVVNDTIEFTVDYPTANIRVEGLSGTIAEGSEKGENALDIIEKVLRKNNIDYKVQSSKYGSYISSIDGLTEKKFGGWDGWMYYVKKSKEVVSPSTLIEGYVPENGDTIIMYYSSGTTPYVNDIQFNPQIVKENSSFLMKFSYKSKDWNSGSDISTPINGAIVSIDNLNYITDNNGEIKAAGLSKGEHVYKISGYNIDKTPTVVMDKGVFVIDNEHAPGLSFDDTDYNNLYNKDNRSILKDIDDEISILNKNSAASFIKNNSADPWAAISLNKLGLKQDDAFIRQCTSDIKKYGVKDFSNTDLEKLIISLIADGYNPYKFSNIDLVSELFSRDINTFLMNDAAFALIVYNYGNIKGNYNISKDKLIEHILNKKVSYKLNNNVDVQGWPLVGDKINPDITGIVINALSTYYENNAKVKETVDNAVRSLSALQNESGYIPDNFGIFSESTSFVVLGLTSIGVNPEGVMFTKQKGDLVSALFSYKDINGQFKHSLDGQDDYMATEQALRALIALKEYKKSGKYNFYDSSIDSSKLPTFNIESASNAPLLPQTGTFFDYFMLVITGLLFIAAGIVTHIKKSKYNRRG